MSEQDSILKMVSEGILSPTEAAKLIAALNAAQEAPAPPQAGEPPKSAEPPKAEAKDKEEAKPKPATMEVQMQRPDGTYYTVHVPTGLIPAVLKIAGVSIKESIKQNSSEAWDGFKTMVKRKANETKESVVDKVTGRSKPQEEPPTPPAPPSATTAKTGVKRDLSHERQIILRMVQNGRLSAEEASRLIAAMDTSQ